MVNNISIWYLKSVNVKIITGNWFSFKMWPFWNFGSGFFQLSRYQFEHVPHVTKLPFYDQLYVNSQDSTHTPIRADAENGSHTNCTENGSLLYRAIAKACGKIKLIDLTLWEWVTYILVVTDYPWVSRIFAIFACSRPWQTNAHRFLYFWHNRFHVM